MSIWKDNTLPQQPSTPAPETSEPTRYDAPSKPELVPSYAAVPVARADTGLPRKESLIAADLTIEGKVEGSGSVRIAGQFKGDVNVQGDLTIEAGQLTAACAPTRSRSPGNWKVTSKKPHASICCRPAW